MLIKTIIIIVALSVTLAAGQFLLFTAERLAYIEQRRNQILQESR